MDELDSLVEDVVRVRSIAYVKSILFDNSYFLSYESKYDNCLIKDIIFMCKQDRIIMSELAINVVTTFDKMDYGMKFFYAGGNGWVHMKPIELAESLYNYLLEIYGEEGWKTGLANT